MMSLVPATLAAIVAVKNGPPGMWRALESPDSSPSTVGFVTSLPWVATLTCGYLVLALVVALRLRRGASSIGSPQIAATAALGVLVVIALLANSLALEVLLPIPMIAAWVALLEAELRQTREHGGGSKRLR